VPAEIDVDPAIRGKRRSRVLADLAKRQHGVVARRQLLDLGFSSSGIDRAIEAARLHAIHRGVYAVGHRALKREGRWMAAVLAVGPGAVLSHRSAAALWGILGDSGRIEVTAPTEHRRRAGLRIHHANLPSDEISVEDGIPLTTVARTLFDLAAVVPRYRVEKAINEAEYRRYTDRVPLAALIGRYPRHRGVRALREILADGRLGDGRTRSELEDRFTAFLRERKLPRPQVNVPVALGDLRIEADCLWPAERVIVECDGRAAHERSRTFESDRSRDRRLQVAGWRPVRVTWHQLDHEPDALEADLRSLLRAS
jgi:very-short-patch-repair endonuclease